MTTIVETSISSYQAFAGSISGPKHRLLNRFQCTIANCDGEKPPATNHDEVIAVQLDDATLVDARMLRVGNRFFTDCGSRDIYRGNVLDQRLIIYSNAPLFLSYLVKILSQLTF